VETYNETVAELNERSDENLQYMFGKTSVLPAAASAILSFLKKFGR